MPEWTLYGFLALLFGAVGAIGAISGPWRRVPRKELSFGVLSRNLLLASVKAIAPDAGLTYKGEKVERLTGLTVSLMNTGDVPINAGDFEGEPNINLSNVKRVFSAEVLRCSPSHLAPIISVSPTYEVKFRPLLMNPGDFVTFRLTVENIGRADASLAARVSGVQAFQTLRAGRHPGYDIGSIAIWSFIALTSVAFAIFAWVSPKIPYWQAVIYSLFTVMPMTAVFQASNEAVKKKRSRWMGSDTEDLAKSTGLYSLEV